MQFKALVPDYTRKDLNEDFVCKFDMTSKLFSDVYQPDEDTYLLIDSLNLES